MVSWFIFSVPLLVMRGFFLGYPGRPSGKDEGDPTLARPANGSHTHDPTLAAGEGAATLSQRNLLARSAGKVIRQAGLVVMETKPSCGRSDEFLVHATHEECFIISCNMSDIIP